MTEKRKNIIIYGASLRGQMALDYYSEERDRVKYFCDGNKSKVGTFIDGIEVISKEELIKLEEEFEVIIASSKWQEIFHELSKIGITDCKVFDVEKLLYSPEEYQNLKNSFHKVIAVHDSFSVGEGHRSLRNSILRKDYGKEVKNIAFVLMGFIDWLVVDSLMKAASQAHCYCIILDNNLRFMDELVKKGIEAYYAEDYDVEINPPDIIFILFLGLPIEDTL